MTLFLISYLLTELFTVWNVENPVGFPVVNYAEHRVMKQKELRCIYSSNFLICQGGQNDVTTIFMLVKQWLSHLEACP